jgi:hypothetical protein
MSVGSERARLVGVMRTVVREWDHVRQDWCDERSRAFGEQYIDAFREGIDRVLPRLEELERVMRKVRTDCE